MISCCPLTTRTSVQYKTSPCGACGGQSGNGTDFSPNAIEFSYNVMKGAEYFVSL